jgi:hypothetical protein
MPEAQEENTDLTLDSPQEVDIIGYRDGTLQILVNLINSNPEFQIGLTLQMGGFLVSGKLIAGDDYFDRLGALMASGMPGTDVENNRLVHDSIKMLGNKYSEQRKDETIERGVTTYIHLMDCTFGDAQFRSTFKALWRGRISEVAGFFIGELAAS